MLDPKEEIKQKIDIVELIGEYLVLKPSGMHGFKANCPFHNEKSPSFHVSSDRQIWHCFGCGEGGDCFSFVMKMEGMDFGEVLMHLGEKVGVEVKRLKTTGSNVKQRLSELSDLAVRFYQKVLASEIGSATRKYIASRGITSELCERFRLGYASKEWDTLTKFLLTRGYSESEIVTAGLGQKKKVGNGLIDRFRDRLMIPLHDQHGKAVGFTGRILPDLIVNTPTHQNSNTPKYMNSPETPIYHKGQLLFGLDLAKRPMKESGGVIITEGNLDVIASHKADVQNVVASSGTALTEDQLSLLARYTKTLIFCFDRDAAGLTAAKRGITLARGQQFDVRAIIIPEDAKDPDDLVQKNPDTWVQLAKHSVPVMEFLIDRTLVGKNLSNVDDKRAIAKEILPFIQEIKEVVEQEHWLQVLGNLLAVDPKTLRTSLQTTVTKKPMTKTVTSPAPEEKKIVTEVKQTKEEGITSLLLGVLLNDAVNFGFLFEEFGDGKSLRGEMLELYKQARALYTTDQNTPPQTLFLRLEEFFDRQEQDDLKHLLIKLSLLADRTFSQLSLTQVEAQVKTLCTHLSHGEAQAKRKVIAIKIRQAEQLGDQQEVQKLLKELSP